jgi:site-specific DNA-methyltransferase (adenine-specific)
MTPYYDHAGITIYHGDCRDVAVDCAVLVTDPPYPNNAGHFVADVPSACEVIRAWRGEEAMLFWSELSHPPCVLPLVAVHVWYRNNVNGRPYEPIYHFARNGRKRRSEVRACPAVFDGVGAGCVEFLGHPTQKSEPVMRWLVSRLDAPGVILDPFMGSGTTLVAAKRLGRQAIGIEIEERYCEIAARRLAQDVLPLDVAGFHASDGSLGWKSL